jgi:N-acetyl-alpha-D-muramate 1-phosphate uridylyltransferase
MISTIVILSGGKATRLYPVTKKMPKAMLELAGRPFIAHQLEMLKYNGFKRVIICAGYYGAVLENYIRATNQYGLTIDFSFDGAKLLGTAGAIKKALPMLEKSFAVIYGDSYLTEDIWPISNFFLQSNKKSLMTVFKNNNKWDTSNIIYADNKIIKYDKKNITQEMQYIDYGLLFFKVEAFSKILENQYYDLADLCVDLINEEQMAGYEAKKRFYEIGSFNGLEETRKYLEYLKNKRRV